MPAHYNLDPVAIEKFLERLRLQSGGGGGQQHPSASVSSPPPSRASSPQALPPQTRPRLPVLNALKRILPGVDSRGEKANKQIPGLEKILAGSQDPGAQRSVDIANALKGSNSVQARDILLQAAAPRQEAPLPPEVQRLQYIMGLGKEDREYALSHEQGRPEAPPAAEVHPLLQLMQGMEGKTPEEQKQYIDYIQRLRGGVGQFDNPEVTGKVAELQAQAKAKHRAPTNVEAQLAHVKQFPLSEQGQVYRSTFGSSRSESDLVTDLPGYARQEHNRELGLIKAKRAEAPESVFQSTMKTTAAKEVMDARATLNTGYADVMKGNIDHIQSVLDDDYFKEYYGSYEFTRGSKEAKSQAAIDFHASIEKVAGAEMMKAIGEFTGAVSDADLVQAAKAATSLFGSTRVSPERARAALASLRDAYTNAVEKRKSLASVSNMEQYNALSQSNILPAGWSVE